MNTAASSIASDLKSIRRWCTRHPGLELPSSAVEYVAQNRKLLTCLIEHVEGRPDRTVLRAQHPELDGSVISSDFFPIARDVVKRAVDVKSGNKLVELIDDDINMLLRVVEYGKYLGEAECFDNPLSSSPVLLPR